MDLDEVWEGRDQKPGNWKRASDGKLSACKLLPAQNR